jgi:YegS/Rv2252/BmrU family lipid kinase
VKYRFIINRHSGTGFGRKELSEMENYFRKALGSFDYVMPKDRTEAVNITGKFLKEGVDRIVAVGGDGTINAVVNGFFENGKPIREDACLVVTEAGSGCDYYKSVTRHNPPENWMELTVDNRPKPVDVGMIQYSDSSCGERYFVNVASVGMTADIVKKKEEQSGYVPRMFRYLFPTLGCLFSSKAHELKIETDEENFTVEALTVSIAKGAYAGGGMQFGLDVLLDDGLFEVTIFEKTNPIGMALKLSRLYSGNYRHVKGIRKLKTRRIGLHSGQSVQCEFDGEVYGGTDLAITVLPKVLKVCFPK